MDKSSQSYKEKNENCPTVFVTCRNVKGKMDARTVRRRLVRILVHLGLEDSEVSCLLCDDSFIKELNQTYRGKDKPTDVLSFSMNEGEAVSGSRDLLGDIVISVDTAIRQAGDLGRAPLEEVTSLLIHGVLHLLGYDHVRSVDESKMQEKAVELEALFLRNGLSKVK
jgi:probable rRNA maturation factor